MSRCLLILRHAKSSWDSGADTDFERPLAERGERDAPRMGQWLNRKHLKPDYVVSSPAERARKTTLRICKELGVKKKKITWDDRIYGSSTPQLLEVLSDIPARAYRVMLVGHNPGLEDLLTTLSDTRIDWPNDGKVLPTAAVAHLEIRVPWSELSRSDGRLLSITRARWLKEQGI